MIYTQALKDALIEATREEVEYSGWDQAYCDKLMTSYDTVTLGTELVSDRDFEDMLSDDRLSEMDLTPIESILLSAGYFGIIHLAGHP